MNTADAAHAVAHDYAHGGTDALAARMGISSGALLRNKVNVNRSPENRNVLSLAEAVRMTAIADDDRILEAWSNERNGVFVQLPAYADTPDNEELLAKFLKLTTQYGALARRHQEATADGEVDAHEMADLKRIGNQIHQTVEEINALTQRIYGRTGKAD